MSDYGADENPDLNIATDLTIIDGLMPYLNTNVMQWTYDDGILVQKYASKQGKSNLLVEMLDPPLGPGDPCGICWGSGKPFGDVETPDRILVHISGLGKSGDWTASLGEPIDGKFFLDQNPAAACTFSAVSGDYEITIIFFPGLVASIIMYQGATNQWVLGTFEVCATTLTGGAQFGFENGIIIIEIPAV